MGTTPPPIVMVHGAFCGGWAFDAFCGPFEAAGHRVYAPNLRGHAPGDSAEAVTGLSMADYAKDIGEFCAGLPEPPILVGHSMGGLVAQLAARRATVRALVLLAPSAPWGVASWSVEEAITAFGLHLLGPYWAQSVTPDRDLMRRYSLDRMAGPAREAIVRQLRPESGRAVYETLNWWLDPFMTTSVGAGPLQAPSLVVAGERDVVHSPATVRQTAERIGGTFLNMPGMSHWLLGEPGWEDVAGAMSDWLAELEAPVRRRARG